MTVSTSFEPSTAAGHAGTTLPASGVHERGGAGDVDEANKPTKQARIMAFLEHEDDTHPLHFQDGDFDSLELHEYKFEEESDEGAATNVASDNVLQRLCVPHSTFEPELDPSELLQLDLLADELEISRLKAMGVLIPAENYDVVGQTPEKLTTRMVRTWRDKHLDGKHVWLPRSRYVAREYAWLSPEREDLFSPASSVLTVRLLPCLFMKWKTDDYVRCSIDITDAFLIVDQRELTQVACEDAGGNVSHYILGKVLPGQRNGSRPRVRTRMSVSRAHAHAGLARARALLARLFFLVQVNENDVSASTYLHCPGSFLRLTCARCRLFGSLQM